MFILQIITIWTFKDKPFPDAVNGINWDCLMKLTFAIGGMDGYNNKMNLWNF
jgi:hypothetical protein